MTTTVFAQDTDVLDIAGERVSLADFEHVFGKNNRDSVYTVEALDEYMELFINFKLKVREAEALGMDTAEAFKKELAGYRTQLARPYLVDTSCWTPWLWKPSSARTRKFAQATSW